MDVAVTVDASFVIRLIGAKEEYDAKFVKNQERRKEQSNTPYVPITLELSNAILAQSKAKNELCEHLLAQYLQGRFTVL